MVEYNFSTCSDLDRILSFSVEPFRYMRPALVLPFCCGYTPTITQAVSSYVAYVYGQNVLFKFHPNKQSSTLTFYVRNRKKWCHWYRFETWSRNFQVYQFNDVSAAGRMTNFHNDDVDKAIFFFKIQEILDC